MHLNLPRALAIALVAGSTLVVTSARAQQTGTGGQTGLTQTPLTQTGESSSFAIQRDVNESVNAVSTNFLSKSSAPGTSGTSYGTVQGFGSLGGGGSSSRSSTLSRVGGSAFGAGAGIGLGNQFGGQFGNQFGSQIGGAQAGTAGQLPLRHRVRIDVSPSPRAITRISREFAARLTRLPGLSGVGSVDVAMEGRIAVLTGSVASEQTRDLVARLAMLEPGIEAVRNELSVARTEALPESLEAPTR